jgi:capsular exopolysaccharide synthesis family protein
MTATSAEGQVEYSLLDYLAIARKRWFWFLLPIIILAGAATYYTLNQPDRYRATARVLIAASEAEQTVGSGPQNANFLNRELSNEVSLAESDRVKDGVEELLGLLPSITITAETTADVLVFTAVAGNATDAADYANTWANQYTTVKGDDFAMTINDAITNLEARLGVLSTDRGVLTEDLDAIDAQIAAAADVEGAEGQLARLDARRQVEANSIQYQLGLIDAESQAISASLSDLRLRSDLAGTGGVQVVQVASPPSNTINAPLSRNLAIGLLLGAVIGGALALMAELRDNTIKSAADVQAITDVPVLASVPAASNKEQEGLSVATHRDPEGKFAEAYHRVRSSIEFASFGDDDVKSVLITSPHASEGKSTTSSNLALALSLVGKRTVLLDLDYRRARIHNIYQIRQNPGLSDFILYGAELSDVAYSVQEEGLEDLLVVPTGTVPPNPAAFVGSGGFLQTLDWLKGQADMIILDAPPMLAVSDVQSLGNHADAVVVVIRAAKTTKPELLEVLAGLNRSGARILGLVMVGVDDAETYGRYYYYRTDDSSSGRNGRVGDLWGGRSSNGRAIEGGQAPASYGEAHI